MKIFVLFFFALFLCSAVRAAVAEDPPANTAVGIPDSGLITLEEVERIMLEVRTPMLDSVMAPPDRNYTDLHQAAEDCDLARERAAVSRFSVKGRSEEVNRLDRNGYTPLAYASRAGCMEVVVYLIERGAVVDRAEERMMWTPLLHAAEEGHVQVVEYLLAHGANVNIRTGTGETPLSVATRGPIFQYGPAGDKDATIAVLLKHGANNES